MMNPLNLTDPGQIAAQIEADILALTVRNIPGVRAVRRGYSLRLKRADAGVVLDTARVLLTVYKRRNAAYELIADHQGAFQRLGETELEEMGLGLSGWKSVDEFGRTLSGPARLAGQVEDGLIHRWARSEELWWRRAALVSTVALNTRSQGGHGDTSRTLAVCRMLAADREDMVVKALSWALRMLVAHDPDAVWAFLEEHEATLAARVKREVRNKLTTGLKNPRRSCN